MEMINILFGISWLLSLILAFSFGMLIAPALQAQRNKMIIEAVGETLQKVIGRFKDDK